MEIKIVNGKCSLWENCFNAGTITCYEALTTDCFLDMEEELKKDELHD